MTIKKWWLLVRTSSNLLTEPSRVGDSFKYYWRFCSRASIEAPGTTRSVGQRVHHFGLG